MLFRLKRRQTIAGDRAGNIAITAALAMPLAIGALALGVDYGSLTLQQRQLQASADLAAIAAAANISTAEKSAFDFFAMNGQSIGVVSAGGLLTTKGVVPFNPKTALEAYGSYAEITRGRYVPDPAQPAANRFVAGATPPDAVRLTLRSKSNLMFGASLTTPPALAASGTAATDKLASFSIGSRLASVNEGVLNALLGQMLGTTISLKAMDYRALADAQVNALKTIDQLALDLGLQSGTYADVLTTDINYGKFVGALGKTTGLTPSVSTVLSNLEKTLNKTKVMVKLEDTLKLGPVSQKLIGQSSGLSVNTSVFDLLSAAATAASGGKQLSVDLGTSIPGVASSKVTVAIGEPPVGSSYLAVGAPGTIVRTAQTRVAVEVVVDGLQAILGLKVRVPLYLEVAYAEGRLAGITCTGAANSATVDVDAVPGIASIALGDVDTTAFTNFGKDPRVTRADIISTLLLKVSAMADTTSTNLKTERLTFSPADISANRVKSTSVKNVLESLTTSLLSKLVVRVDLLGLGLGLPQPIISAVGATLGAAMTPVDTVLYNVLLTLGVRVGEADVQVGGASCRNPVLVQ